MRRVAWLPFALIVLGAAAITGYGYSSSRHAAIDAPSGSRRVAVDDWLEQDVSVPAGTEVSVVLQSNLDTRSTRAGDVFAGRVAAAVTINGEVAIPQGAFINGHVAQADGAGRAGKGGRLQLDFDAVSYGGRWYRLDSEGPLYVGGIDDGTDATVAASGEVVGGMSDGVVGGTTTGAAKGALVGGADDIAAPQDLHGQQLVLPEGATVRFHLAREMFVTPVRSPV